MRHPRGRTYDDELGRAKRVDRSALRIIAKHSEKNDREVFVLDPKRMPERLGNRRKQRS
jgi:hypothetical protein